MKALVLAAALLGGDPVDELIDRLGSDDPFERDRATDALKKLGRRAKAPLKALRTVDAEVAWRRDAILEHLAGLQETALLVSIVQVRNAVTRVAHAGGDALPLAMAGVHAEGRVEDWGLRARIDLEGRSNPRLTRCPWGRLVRLGMRDEWETYVCVQRDAAWRQSDPAVIDDILRGEIARPFEIGVPEAFQLLIRSSAFPRLVPALEERLKTTADPTVREACHRAIECQRRRLP